MADMRWDRAPWGLLGLFAAVVAIEAGLGRLDRDLARPEMSDWRAARERARGRATDAAILAFGTSLTQVGFQPAVIERETGRSAHNLAVYGGRIIYSYYNLRRALDAGARPAAVVIDLHPSFLTGGSYLGQSNGWTDALGAADCLDMAWSLGDGRFLGMTAVARALPSYRRRYEVRDAVRAALDGRSWSFRDQSVASRSAAARNRGAVPPLAPPPHEAKVTPVDEQLWLGAGRRFDPVEVTYLERFVALAARRGITVYAVMMPVHPDLQRRRDDAGLDAQFERLLRRIEARPNVVLVDARRAGYPVEAFYDASHLQGRGAQAFSRGLGRLIAEAGRGGAEHAPGGGRVALAEYRATREDRIAAESDPAAEGHRQR